MSLWLLCVETSRPGESRASLFPLTNRRRMTEAANARKVPTIRHSSAIFFLADSNHTKLSICLNRSRTALSQGKIILVAEKAGSSGDMFESEVQWPRWQCWQSQERQPQVPTKTLGPEPLAQEARTKLGGEACWGQKTLGCQVPRSLRHLIQLRF